MQQGDVLLGQTIDDGNINVSNGLIEMTGGFETAVYLSLFGGNENDDGRVESIYSWWGNTDELDPVNQYHSETQHLLQSIPATSGNLIKVEDAVNVDLAWFIDEKIASSITVTASIPELNRIRIIIIIEAQGVENTFEFVENWKAML